jgi:hypothetical protein
MLRLCFGELARWLGVEDAFDLSILEKREPRPLTNEEEEKVRKFL